MVNHYRDIVKKAAEYKIMLDVHEPIKATGIRRTYPNMMTREGARGQEYNAWSGDGGNPPDHTTILPFTRLLGGPMDFTPGIIDLTFDHANRIDNRVNTTLAKQLALYVVLYSPLQMAADLPENYKDEPAFQFIKDVPVDWETTLVPHGEIGDYVVIVRKDRNSDDWYIAGITDENERDLTIELFFLDKNKQYTATIYSAPLILHNTGIDEHILKRFHLDCPQADLSEWERVVQACLEPERDVNVAMVGKYMDLLDAYKSLIEAIKHAGIYTKTRVNMTYIDSETLDNITETGLEEIFDGIDAIVVPGGFGERGIEGMVATVQFARERNIPYLGICLGLHVAVIEYARHVLGLEGAHSTEFKKPCKDPVIALITEWTNTEGSVEVRDENSELGGTMRLGGQECLLEEGSIARNCYQKEVIVERHRHRYEVNNNYVERLEQNGMRFTGKSMDNSLMEVLEVTEHPWFVACQFHPEFTSTPRDGHPLFTGFIMAAINRHDQVSAPTPMPTTAANS